MKITQALEKILAVPPREIAGSQTALKYQYQRHWGLLQLLNYHKEGREYIIFFDYHDDVLVIDDNGFNFFQVKASGAAKPQLWTLNKLLTEKSGASILGKICMHKTQFKNSVYSMNFVSNCGYSFNCVNSEKFSASQLKLEDKNKIKNEISKQIPQLDDDLIFIEQLFFHISPLNLNGSETYLKGELEEFFTHIFGEEHRIPITIWYKNIMDTIIKKNNFSAKNYNNSTELIRRKGIKKEDIDKFIDDTYRYQKSKPSWGNIEHFLLRANIREYDFFQLKEGWNEVIIRLANKADKLFLKQKKIIENHFQKEYLEDYGICELMDIIYADIMRDKKNSIIYRDNKFLLKAIILLIYQEKMLAKNTNLQNETMRL